MSDMIISQYLGTIQNQYLERLKKRFWKKVKKTSTCWLWIGSKKYNRGLFRVGPFTSSAPRIAWELDNGPIPEGFCVLHSCNNPACVNISHLRTGTHQENMGQRDAEGRNNGPLWNSSKTHCPKGHPYSLENTWLRPSCGYSRNCRTCHRDKQRTKYQKKKLTAQKSTNTI